MSYRVTLRRYGAEVQVETVAEVVELLEALFPRLEMTVAGPSIEIPPDLMTSGLHDRAVAAARDRTTQTNQVDVERGLLVLLAERPRSGHELAEAADLAQVTISRYLRTMEAAGKVHQQGAGRFTKWHPGPKEEP